MLEPDAEVYDADDLEDDVDLDELTPELALLHDMQSRRGALDAHADRYGLDAVNRLIARGLAQTAELGVAAATVPDELARFAQADTAAWVHLAAGLWLDNAAHCGASRRDDLGELEEFCLLAPHAGPDGHAWDRGLLPVAF